MDILFYRNRDHCALSIIFLISGNIFLQYKYKSFDSNVPSSLTLISLLNEILGFRESALSRKQEQCCPVSLFFAQIFLYQGLLPLSWTIVSNCSSILSILLAVSLIGRMFIEISYSPNIIFSPLSPIELDFSVLDKYVIDFVDILFFILLHFFIFFLL